MQASTKKIFNNRFLTHNFLIWPLNDKSNLKLPLAGLRWEDNGKITHAARYGKYWNGSISNRGNARNMDFGGSLDLVANNRRADGLSVRCIKDK